MLTILQTQFLALIMIYIHSLNFFIALAAPVRETSSVLRKREPQHSSGIYAKRNVHSRDNTISNWPMGAPAASYLGGRNPAKSLYALRVLKASAEREPQTLERRNIFSDIGNAFKKAGNAVKSGFQRAGHAITNVAQKVGSGVKSAAQKVGSGIKNAAQKVGSVVKNAAQKVGSGVKNVAQKVGSGVKNVAQKAGNGIKNVAQKIGNGVKTAAKVAGNGLKTAGKWVKDNGAKIAKVGLKAVSTYWSVGSKLANFIPGVGKTLSKGLKAGSAALDLGSNAIHADVSGGGLGKAMGIMDKIQHPLSGVGGQVLDAVLSKRDIGGEELVFRRNLGVFVKEREFEDFFF